MKFKFSKDKITGQFRWDIVNAKGKVILAGKGNYKNLRYFQRAMQRLLSTRIKSTLQPKIIVTYSKGGTAQLQAKMVARNGVVYASTRVLSLAEVHAYLKDSVNPAFCFIKKTKFETLNFKGLK